MIKDWKERYFQLKNLLIGQSCGLIKDWKERYWTTLQLTTPTRCGLIKDWKERYLEEMFKKAMEKLWFD